MKRQKSFLFLGICLSAALGFCGCSSDDEPNEPTLGLRMENNSREIGYFIGGTFEKTIKFSEPVETPKPEDFTFVSRTNQTKVFHLDWDTTEPGEDVNSSETKLRVTNVKATENPSNGYVLTIDYDVYGFMAASMDKVQIVYKGNIKTSNSFDFSYKGCAQRVLQAPTQQYRLDGVPTSEKIEIGHFLYTLGIAYPSEVHGVEGRHCIYASPYGEEIDLNSEFHLKGKKNITFSADYEGSRPVLTIHGLDKLKPESMYYVQLIYSLGQNEYVALHVPIQVTADM